MKPSKNDASNETENFVIDLAMNLDKESDRGLAIIVGAYIEQLLKEAIIKHFEISSKKKQNEIFEGPTSLLGTFSSKIIFSHITGIIDDTNKNDIYQIKQIRNEFAHRFSGASFSTEKVVQLCDNLKLAKVDGTPKTAREKFKKASVRIMMNLIAN